MSDNNQLVLLGALMGSIVTAPLILILCSLPSESVLSCQEGKLYEVTHDGNITIYSPTYNNCKEIK